MLLNGLFDAGEQLLRVGDVCCGGVAKCLEVAEGGASVFPGVGQALGSQESDRDVEAGLGGIKAVISGFEESDRVAVMRQGAVNVASVAVDFAQLIMHHGQVVHGIVGQQLKCLVVRLQGGIDVLEQFPFRLIRLAALTKLLERDRTELGQTMSTARVVSEELQTPAIPLFGFLQIPDCRDVNPPSMRAQG